MKQIKMILTAVSFLRNDEPQEPYGISCLVDAFNSGNQEGDTIIPYIIDCNQYWNDIKEKFDVDWGKMAEKAAAKIIASGCNVAAFSCFAWCDSFCKLVLRKIKGNKNIEKIVLGGPTIVGGLETMQKEFPQADLFIESYGEKVFANLRKYFSENKKYVLDLPDFCELQSPYLSGRIHVSEEMTVRMELRRGCCFQCTYCRYKDNKRQIYRIGNRERWQQELQLFKKAKVKKINVLDAFFNEQGRNKKMGLDFLKYCKQIGLDADISLQIRPECLDDDYLDVLSQLPNVIVEIGIQSLDEKVMKAIKRGNREKVLQTLEKVAKLGIRTEITMIYGLPHQTAESFKKDLYYLDGFGFETLSAFQLSIYNGTELYETYQNYGLKAKRDSIGVLFVYDNPTHDIDLMKQIYQDFIESKKSKAA
jgi:radical SAM superfamily enzyme YgiQ (UPF0313 family)